MPQIRSSRLVRTVAVLSVAASLAAACGSGGQDSPQETVTVTVPASRSAVADDPGSTGTSTESDVTTDASTTDTPTTDRPTGLPQMTPSSGAPAACAGMRAAGSGDITHPTWGRTRVFALLGSGIGPQRACLVAVDTTDRVRWSFVDDNGESRWAMATPASDATGNLFVTYNPGRYDGVIVLHPTASGFAPIGAGYAEGPLRYYYAELQGPGASGQYTIKQSNNDCDPSCAGGTVTSKILRWNGTEYVG